MDSHDDIPTVSVVLSVRNGGSDLPQALDTILKQSFSDFELIAINNGSTDGTREFLDQIADPRVRVYHQDDQGLAAALNRGISLARGRYIARQDHDDLADPTGRVHDHPIEDTDLRFALLFNNYFVHSSVMMRKAALDEVGYYSIDRLRQPPEDYELWSRIARRFRVANLPERLTVYREVPTSMSRESADPFKEKLILISAENIAAATIQVPEPRTVHRDIASLIHGAPEKMSRGADIEEMCAALAQAGRTIFGDRKFHAESDPVAFWIQNLRYHFNVHTFGLHRARKFAGGVKNALRRLGLSIYR
jgi:cellulose synthase/poly-beta-1,6-N-acetylglucosamine synthase-like glycosyltransferase